MIAPIWHDGPLDRLSQAGEAPVAWLVAHGGGDKRERRDTRRRLACELIARLSGQDAAVVRLGHSPHGAPIVVAPAGWYLGLASRGSESLIGVARRPVAVDRELRENAPPLWDMLTEAERRDLRSLPAALQPDAWLRRWTIKEAHAKLVGEPRRIAPEMIETHILDAVRATACFEGRSSCWTRESGGAIETLVTWAEPAPR